jgi:bacterioferritin-associated ferredoxin
VRIDRCVCDNVTFSRLAQIAERANAHDVTELRVAARREHVEFGRTCKLCVPYVRAMLRDGTTVFDHILVDDDRP